MSLWKSGCDWDEVTYSGRGVILGYRECLVCGRKQTRLHNYATGEDEWVDGKFVDSQEREFVFVFAGSGSAFHATVKKMLKFVSLCPASSSAEKVAYFAISNLTNF
jgi:hypothetical protein